MYIYRSIYKLTISFYSRFKIPIEHKLHNCIDWFISSANSKKFNNISVVKSFHHVSLTQKINLFIERTSKLEGLHSNCNLKNANNLGKHNENIC